jgi:hypothetical protein
MIQLSIRCHPLVPVSADELEHWLELQVSDLRKEAPQGTIRLLRLTQERPDASLDIGWLLELELPQEDPLFAQDHLAGTLRDMRLLGLQPTILAPVDLSGGFEPGDDLVGPVSDDAFPRLNGSPRSDRRPLDTQTVRRAMADRRAGGIPEGGLKRRLSQKRDDRWLNRST